MDMHLTGQARYRRLAWGLALAALLALVSLALIGGLFGWLMSSLGNLGSPQSSQARSALPLLGGLAVTLGLLLRWRLRSQKRRAASRHSDRSH